MSKKKLFFENPKLTKVNSQKRVCLYSQTWLIVNKKILAIVVFFVFCLCHSCCNTYTRWPFAHILLAVVLIKWIIFAVFEAWSNYITWRSVKRTIKHVADVVLLRNKINRPTNLNESFLYQTFRFGLKRWQFQKKLVPVVRALSTSNNRLCKCFVLSAWACVNDHAFNLIYQAC